MFWISSSEPLAKVSNAVEPQQTSQSERDVEFGVGQILEEISKYQVRRILGIDALYACILQAMDQFMCAQRFCIEIPVYLPKSFGHWPIVIVIAEPVIKPAIAGPALIFSLFRKYTHASETG